jgi:hypothetical protein
MVHTMATHASTIPRSSLRPHRPVEIGGRPGEKADDGRKRRKKDVNYRTKNTGNARGFLTNTTPRGLRRGRIEKPISYRFGAARGGEQKATEETEVSCLCCLPFEAAGQDKRSWPAIDPLNSWSRYREQLQPYFDAELDPFWTATVNAMHKLLFDGENINQMMQVTGEEGITIEDFVTFQKSLFLDMVYLQQDPFDEVETTVPLERQRQMFLRPTTADVAGK